MSLYDRVRALAETLDVPQPRDNRDTGVSGSVPLVPRACEVERNPPPSLSLYSLFLSPRARKGQPGRGRPVLPVKLSRWSDRSSALFWLRHRGWPALDVDGVLIEGEPQWRRWVGSASLTALLAVRDRVAP